MATYYLVTVIRTALSMNTIFRVAHRAIPGKNHLLFWLRFDALVVSVCQVVGSESGGIYTTPLHFRNSGVVEVILAAPLVFLCVYVYISLSTMCSASFMPM